MMPAVVTGSETLDSRESKAAWGPRRTVYIDTLTLGDISLRLFTYIHPSSFWGRI